MPDYRCYLINVGHIFAAEVLVATDDGHAVELGKAYYHTKKHTCSGFEVWERDRVVHRFINGE